VSASKTELWQRSQKYCTELPGLGLAIGISRMNFIDDYLASMKAPIQKAFIAMAELEKAFIAKPDEKRRVGHYWLRDPALGPKNQYFRPICIEVALFR
jgi:glucose-6-phosphate isomerase